MDWDVFGRHLMIIYSSDCSVSDCHAVSIPETFLGGLSSRWQDRGRLGTIWSSGLECTCCREVGARLSLAALATIIGTWEQSEVR